MTEQDLVEEAIEVLEVYGNDAGYFISPFGAGRYIGASDEATELACEAWSLAGPSPIGHGMSALEAAQLLREGRRVVNGRWTRKART